MQDQHGVQLRDAKVTVFLPQGTSEVIKVSKNSGQFKHMLAEGTHKIVASLDGYLKYKATIHVDRETMTHLKIVLETESGVGKVEEVRPASATTSGQKDDNYDYYYYPRKKLLEIKDKHSRHFDIYK